MYTGTIPESADFIASVICSSAELTLQKTKPTDFVTRAIVLPLI